MELTFSGRLGIQQRLLPHYRADFFDELADRCLDGLSVVAGQVGPRESLKVISTLQKAKLVTCRNLHFLNASSPYYLLWQKGLLNWLRHWDPHVLIVEANHRYLSTRAAIRWMHSRGRPVIGWGLGVYQPGGVGKRKRGLVSLQEWWRQSFLSSFDGFIAYSKKGAEEVQSLGFHHQPVFIAPNAVIRKPTWTMPIRPDEFDNRPSILFVGRLQARKRIDNLVKACAALPEGIQPNVWIVGDGPERSKLESLAKSIYPRAKVLGAMHDERVTSYFKSADLFVLPGTGGLAVQEAMAYGLPVVVAEGDGTQKQFVSEQNGWLIPQNNLNALIDSLKVSLSNPSRLRKMGQESYRIVFEEFNLENMVENFINAVYTINQNYEGKGRDSKR
jgi:glycosyltransferase involved in cell wall biosynthesis